MKKSIAFLIGLIFLSFSLYEMFQFSAPSTLEDFFLPGSQPGDSGNFESPGKCDNCHGNYNELTEPDYNWKGSMMAQAMRDPLFKAAMTIANQDAPFSGDLCIRCHSPQGWLEGRSVPTDGSALTASDREGITCDFCHSLVKPSPIGVNPYPNNPTYTLNTYPIDQAYLSTIDSIPLHSANGMYVAEGSNSKRGPFNDVDANHPFTYSNFHSSSDLCGTCHDVSNPAFNAVIDGNGNTDYVLNEFDEKAPSFSPYSMMHIERTYSEWKMSEYNTPEGVQSSVFGGNLASVSSCQDCHMQDVTGYGCNKNPPLRNNLPLHDLTGANTFIPKTLFSLFPGEVDTNALNDGIERARFMLENAATMILNVDQNDVSVKITNETGHKLPSGYPEGRRIWLNVKAWGENGEVFETGKYDLSTATLFHDPSIKVYETKPGLSPALASVLNLPPGPSFHFVLNDTVYKDNRIPPRGFTNANFKSIQAEPVGYTYSDGQYWDETSYPIPFEPIAVVANLYYQTVSKEYIEFLLNENITDDNGQILYDLWNQFGKSTPELMVSSNWGAPIIDNDKDGFIQAVDCNDDNSEIFPNALELFDCIDNDCDNLVDEDYSSEIHFVWNGCQQNGNWNDGQNWNFGLTPGSNDHVIIPQMISGNIYPQLGSNHNIKSILIENGASLTIGQGVSLTIMNSGNPLNPAMEINGDLICQGSLNLNSPNSSGIVINSNGNLSVSGIMNINTYQGYGIENLGTISIASEGELTIIKNGNDAIYNSDGAQMEVHGTLCLKL